jgi:xylulokinase
MMARRTPSPLLLGVDLGTTAIKAGLFDLAGRPLGQASTRYPTQRPAPGLVEQEAQVWWRSIEGVVAEVARLAGADRVAAIGICSQVNTHVFVDARGEPLLPAIVWQDQRAAPFAEGIDRPIDERARDRIWGSATHVDASSPLARVAWCASERPEVLERSRWLLSPKDFCNSKLTGEVASDPASAIGLVDETGDYLPGALALVPGVSELLPPLRAMTSVLGEARVALGPVRPGAPVVVGTMDAWASRYGSGVVAAGQGMEVAGTSEILGLLSDRPGTGPGVVTFPPIDGRWFHAGPTQAGGDALRWWASLQSARVETVLAEAARAPLGSGGLVFLPHLMGERAPLWDAMLRGAFVGISADHGRAHLARAVLEGVAFSARHLLEALEEAAGRPCSALRASGGGADSDLWCQMKADVLGRPLERVAVRSSGVLGAAMLAGAGVGLLEDLDHAASRLAAVERRFEPDPEAHERYRDLYECYRSLQHDLTPTYRTLARFRRSGVLPKDAE